MSTHASPPRTDDERLDWVTFLARFYPDARRHDYESLAAYVEYRKAPSTRVQSGMSNKVSPTTG